MHFMRSVALAGTMVFIAVPVAAAPTPGPEHPIRKIAIVLNGETLQSEVAPEVLDGHLFVPLRTLLGALGINVSRAGSAIAAQLHSGNMVVTVGSKKATINGRSIELDAAPVDLEGTTFVPLRFLSTALGANTTYDQKGAKVEIVTPYSGQSLTAERALAGGGQPLVGAVAALDRNSSPPTLTILERGNPRTIAVTSDARVYVEDVSIRSQVRGALEDIRVGDAVRAVVAKNGRVVEVHDFFKSISGVIAAVSPSAVVLGSGRVITPDRATEISLNSEPAKIGDLRVGDDLTVRSNPETGEMRQIIVSRAVANTAAPSASVAITSFSISATRALRAGEFLDVIMQGTPGGRATFDIGDYVPGTQMREDAPGTYRARFTIPDRFNLAQVPIYGHLVVGSVQAPRAEAATRFSSATTPPQIGSEYAPADRQIVNNPRPNIFATYRSPSEVGIDANSVTITVNGQNVTGASTRTATFIAYSPTGNLPDGDVAVSIRVVDAAGNVGTRSWSFTIKTR